MNQNIKEIHTENMFKYKDWSRIWDSIPWEPYLLSLIVNFKKWNESSN